MIYFDSSALVKRYLREEGTEAVKSILGTSEEVSTSKLTYPEILSAFMRKWRAHEIEKRPFQTAVDQFEDDWKHMLVIEFHDQLLDVIKRVMQRYPLKAADSVHLSSALWHRGAAKENITFVTSDVNLLRAAQAEKLKAINPLS
jgi:predicted nucleic acid-binding protein